MEAVNRGLGIENAKKFTVNPLVFLETATQSAGSNPATSSANRADPVVSSTIRTEETHIAASSATIPSTTSSTTAPSSLSASDSSTSVSVPFSDVTLDSPYITAITFLKTQGIVSGQGGKFSPKSKVTRGELLKMVLLSSKTPLSSTSKQIFSDVPANDPFAQFVATASEKKIVS